MNGSDIEGALTGPTSGAGPPIPVLVGLFVGVLVGVAVGVVVGVLVGVAVAVVVGVLVGVLVGVVEGVVVGVLVGVDVLGATQAGSVLVAPLQGPEALTQLEPVPQKTWPPEQAALLMVEQAPVVVLMQQPVAWASARRGASGDNKPSVTTVTATSSVPSRFSM